MQIEDSQKQRMGASMEALNARIARLAMALNIPLQDEAAVKVLMEKSGIAEVLHERRVQATNQPAVHHSHGPERRIAQQREELRGLLLLRYHMEATSLNTTGLESTREMLLQVEENLVRQGFKPGADGLGMDDFFNPV